MPEPAPSSPPKNSGSFASLLSSFASRPKQEDTDWDLSALADDVATISYEQALRAHRRVRSFEPATETLPNEFPQVASLPPDAPPQPTCKKKRKAASITLRLTAAEQAQLQERATAAQLSVSAYIRSCIFEAESLRAQVKEALSQMHAGSRNPTSANSTEKQIRNWHKRFFPRWSRGNTAES